MLQYSLESSASDFSQFYLHTSALNELATGDEPTLTITLLTLARAGVVESVV